MIIQAAGRVNRNQNQPMGDLFVFEPVSEHIRRVPAAIQQAMDVARLVLKRFPDDPISLEAVQAYYNDLYDLHDESAFDARRILACFEKDPARAVFDFQTAAKDFKLIDEETVAVIVPFDPAAEALLAELRAAAAPFDLARQLQPYTVNVYESEFDTLMGAGQVDTYFDSFFVLNERGSYNPLTGLEVPSEGGGQGIIY